MSEPISLEELTDTDSVTRRLRAAGFEINIAQPNYVRHKPGETTIIAYRFSLAEAETLGYIHWCARPDRASEIHAKAASRRPQPSPLGQGLTRLDSHSVLFWFPNDARLKRLHSYTDPRELCRLLEPLGSPDQPISKHSTTAEILRYKPRRRMVAKVNLNSGEHGGQALLIRYSVERQAQRLAGLARRLRDHGVSTPAPIAQLEDSRVAVDQFVPGRQLSDAIQENGADGATLAEALLGFHTTTPPSVVYRRTVDSELEKARLALTGLSAWHPAIGPGPEAMAELLKRTAPGEPEHPVLLHGDLHAENILVQDEVTTFVDLDRVAVGPAAIDLGYFNAHAIALTIRRPNCSSSALHHAETMIDHYRRSARTIDSHALAWHTAVGLVDQALLVARHLEHRWQSISAGLLEAASRQLEPATSLCGVNP